VCRLIDRKLLPILVWVYFLQVSGILSMMSVGSSSLRLTGGFSNRSLTNTCSVSYVILPTSLQSADPYSLAFLSISLQAAVWGLREDAKLVGNQYSTMASMNAIAQLAWLVSHTFVQLSAQ
jgi:hypothetical protein